MFERAFMRLRSESTEQPHFVDTWIDRTVGDTRMNKIVKSMIAVGFALGIANSAFSAAAL